MCRRNSSCGGNNEKTSLNSVSAGDMITRKKSKFFIQLYFKNRTIHKIPMLTYIHECRCSRVHL